MSEKKFITMERKWIIMIAVALLAILMIGAVSVMAVGNQSPCPVNGNVDPAFANWEVKITRMASGTTRTVYTGSSGFFGIDWANVEYYNNGDEFKVQIGDKVYTTYHNGVAVEFGTVDASGLQAPCQTTVCKTCDICQTCEKCQDCPVLPPVDNSAEALAFALGGLLAGAVGVKTYQSKYGPKTVHKHPGIVGYHDPNTIHKNTLIKHLKGEVAPKYDAEGKYVKKV